MHNWPEKSVYRQKRKKKCNPHVTLITHFTNVPYKRAFYTSSWEETFNMKGSFGVRKGAWTEEEDILLKQCIQKHGEGKWHLVPVSAGIILESRVSEIDFSFFLGKPSSFCLCLLCLLIPYRTGRYIPYRSLKRYKNTCFVPVQIPVLPGCSGYTGRNIMLRLKNSYRTGT